MKEHLENKECPEHDALVRVLIFLGLCHTVVIDGKKGTYNAASPDELAIVNAAKQFGYEFLGLDKQDNLLLRIGGGKDVLRYQLLNVCEFNSNRKRMSVIIKTPDGKYMLMCKGADSVITDRLSEESLKSSMFTKT